MSNLLKHKILKQLSKIYIERTYDGTNYTESGKSQSTEELNIVTSCRLDELSIILSSLKNNDYIKQVCLNSSNSTFYVITDKGFDALSDKRFLWYSLSTAKIYNLATLLISIIALLVSILKD